MLELLQVNVTANQLPPERVAVCHLEWGTDLSPDHAVFGQSPHFDIVVGSELIYPEKVANIPPLLHTAKQLLSTPESVFILSYTERLLSTFPTLTTAQISPDYSRILSTM